MIKTTDVDLRQAQMRRVYVEIIEQAGCDAKGIKSEVEKAYNSE